MGDGDVKKVLNYFIALREIFFFHLLYSLCFVGEPFCFVSRVWFCCTDSILNFQIATIVPNLSSKIELHIY